MKRLSNRSGFSIIEILLAVALLTSVTALAWASVSQMFKTRDSIEVRAERFQMVGAALQRMSREISSAYLAGPEHGGQDLPGEDLVQLARNAGDEEEAFQLQRDREVEFGFIGTENSLHFTSFAHVRTFEGERAGYHVNIGYFTRASRNEDGELVTDLVRRQNTVYSDDLQRGGIIYKMVPEIHRLRFEYWDPGEPELGTYQEMAQGRWVSNWDTTRREFSGRLPTRVRMTLEMPPVGMMRQPETFTTQTTIYLHEVLEF